MEKQKPSVGRVVHFHAKPGAPAECALVVAVHSDTCINLAVFDHVGAPREERSTNYQRPDDTVGKYWCWPPRV